MSRTIRPVGLSLALFAHSLIAGVAFAGEQPHNVILFVPDGLRASSVDETIAPTLADIRRRGVDFSNSHSLFPTVTTPNASAMATGHYLGDTGDFGNVIFLPFRVKATAASETPFLESDPVIDEVDDHFGGNPILGAMHNRFFVRTLAQRGELERLIAWYSR